ncbi:MAG: hypothetical protein JNJ46_22600 [Myxococcales bacterium]|nr:hypothetical protein [Myxococcales bacterium]
MTPARSLQIDQLHLEGLPFEHAGQLAPLIEHELRLLLSRHPGLDTAAPALRSVPSIALSADESPQSASRKIAAAIYQSVLQGSQPPHAHPAPSSPTRPKEGRS